MAPNVLRGITLVDPERHIALSNYRRHAPEGEGVHVIEMANGVAAHLENRLLVFGRWITFSELEVRQAAFREDPVRYGVDHLASLSE